jgi:hypothetical protein
MKSAESLISRRAVLPTAIAAFLIPVILIEYPILQFTHGVFAYPIDDTCIHLSIAKNLALHGVWGTYSGEFASAASSILYPLLLALTVKIFGAHLVIPIVVNLLASIILLAVIQKWLIQQALAPFSQLMVLIAVISLTPLAPLAISGMEHVLQFLFVFLFVTRFSAELEKLESSETPKWKLSPRLLVYSMLMAATRYECLVILVIALFILLVYKKPKLAIQMLIIGALPMAIFGNISVANGNFFLPNSVLLKSGAPPLTLNGLYFYFAGDFLKRLFFSIVGYNTVGTQRLLLLLLLSFFVFRKPIIENARYKYILLLLSAAVFVHLSLTGFARFPRYEAYLVGFVVCFVGMLTAKYAKGFLHKAESDHMQPGPQLSKAGLSSWLATLTILFLTIPLGLRSIEAFDQVIEGSYATYKIQYTAGRFLHSFYNTDPVAVEALGAVSYFSDGKKMDILGLGDINVAKSLKEHRYTVEFLDSLSRKENVQIALASEVSTPGELLKRWIKVGTIYAPLGEVAYYMSFYAVNPNRAAELRKNLMQYQTSLPEGVKAIYY